MKVLKQIISQDNTWFYDVYGSLEELPRDTLERHFDYESYGEVCSYDGGFTKQGFIIVQKRGEKK